jgi:hypothetical protein
MHFKVKASDENSCMLFADERSLLNKEENTRAFLENHKQTLNDTTSLHDNINPNENYTTTSNHSRTVIVQPASL